MGILIPVGDGRMTACWFSPTGYAGIGKLDGLEPQVSGERGKASRLVLVAGQRYTAQATVRAVPEGVDIQFMVDNRNIGTYRGRTDRLSLSALWRIASDRTHLILGANRNVTFHQVMVKALDGAKVETGTPIGTVIPVAAVRELPADDSWLELLPLLPSPVPFTGNLNRPRLGEWSMNSGALVVTQAGNQEAVSLPALMPESYDVSIRALTDGGGISHVGVLFPVGGQLIQISAIQRAEGPGGLTFVDKIAMRTAQPEPTKVGLAFMQANVETLVEIAVRGSGERVSIGIKANGKSILDWSGTQSQLARDETVHRGCPAGMISLTGTMSANATFRDVRARRVTGAAMLPIISADPSAPEFLLPANITKRLAEIRGSYENYVAANQPSAADWTNALARVDPVKNAERGAAWIRTTNGIEWQPNSWDIMPWDPKRINYDTTFSLSTPLAPSYAIETEFTGSVLGEDVGVLIPIGDGRMVTCWFSRTGYAGLGKVDGKDPHQDTESGKSSRFSLVPGQRYTVLANVRRAPEGVDIQFAVDGKIVGTYRGAIDRLTLSACWRVGPDRTHVMLGANRNVVFHRASVRVLDDLKAGEKAPPLVTMTAGVKSTLPAEVSEHLAKIRAAYDSYVSLNVIKPHEASVAALDGTYLKALERVRDDDAKKGESTAAAAAIAEIARVRKREALPPGDNAVPAVLKPLRVGYRAELTKLEQARDAKMPEANRRYETALGQYQVQLIEERSKPRPGGK